MLNCLTKNLLKTSNFEFDEIVLSQQQSLHLKIQPNTACFLYLLCGSAIFYPLDKHLSLLDSVPRLPGQTFTVPNKATAILIESLGTFDEDLKLIKLTYKEQIDA
tara:strand:+ start:36450 stop:36764 length:315 start_codon:yes stop_codon:yes gene_type:complete